MRTKQKMVGWFDPVQLLQTGIRVAISTVFGQFADRREALAAANAIAGDPFDSTFDYSKAEGDFWLDFAADTGDGWDSTYAVARRLAAASLKPDPEGEVLPRGRLLVLGGDQVYPTASPEEYENRLLYPFDEAHHPTGGAPLWDKGERPDIYAIPGNHDWYDGLRAFFHLFCRRTIAPAGGTGVKRDGRVIGGRQTRQTRSYFALKLPNKWWLWGTDSQLEGYIDQPQIDYFQYVAEHWMEKDAKLILCVGTPDWEYVDPDEPEKKLATLSYLERLAGAVQGKTIRLGLVLSGDSHHYARFQESSTQREEREGTDSTLDYITSGGGGAFLHPTHHLKPEKKFVFDYPPPGVRWQPGDPKSERRFALASKPDDGSEALYPTRARSRLMAFGNFLFAFCNWKFPLVLWPAYALFTWLLDFNARVTQPHPAGAMAPDLKSVLAGGSLCDSLYAYWHLVIASPWPVILCAVALGGYRYFADVENSWGRLVMGAIHALFQAAAVTIATCVVIRVLADCWDAGWWGPSVVVAAATGAAAFLSATMFGLYLWFSLFFMKRHWNEAFSSLPSFLSSSHKNFLRMKIGADGALTVYPIGIHKPDAEPHLIEPPIRIVP
jgi:hypothetical protein